MSRGWLVAAISYALLFSPSSAFAGSDPFDLKRPDHQLHATVSYGATISTHLLLKEMGIRSPQFYAASLVLVAGLIKEGTDKRFSEGDLAADALGITTATFFTITFDL